jgi:class 3 adenylate cyclase/tetratricopeptide (TPR) repeat protein
LEAQPRPRQVEGERKLVTVLFADVVGSTAMGERLDPELITEVMNGAFKRMNQAVDRYGGTVSRLMGDAVLAIFGAPISHEDDPERAIRAGLEIVSTARDYAAEIDRQYGVDFQVRVGIHTGLAVLDRVGDRIRAEYTAMGDTPNVAARMQSAAAPGTVLVSADTHRLSRHAFDFEPRGRLDVKGKTAPIEAWQAIGPKAAPLSARGLAGLEAPLVGRDAQLARLQARLEGLRPEAPGGWVALTGEAGLGKSRLVAELRGSQASPADVMWLEGRCISYGQGISYLPWRQVIRQSLGVQEDEPADSVRAKLEYSACECCRLPGGDIPFLEAMLAVASEESLKRVMGYSGDDLVRQMTDAVRGYLCAQAAIKPLVIVLEDLHWADEASLALLENVVELVPEHSMLLIGLIRPDPDAPAWALAQRIRQSLGHAFVTEIALEPLSVDQSRHLLGLLLQIEDLPDQVRSLILEKSEGNPFFVEEVIRSLLDSGHIVREEGFWRATRAIEKVSIPSTLAGLLAARIDALPDEAKRVAQISAVVGRSFAFRVLEAVCAAEPAAERIALIAPPLDLLTRQEIVRVQAAEPDLTYAFKHALTQEAAYTSLLIRRRREFHGRAGQALEQLYPERLEELAPTLAHHFREAEDWPRAAAYALRAGDAALRVYALREAMRQYEYAVEALDKASGDETQIYAALMGWAKAAFKFRPYAEQLERLTRAEQIARRRQDKRRLAETLHAIGAVHLARGRSLRAVPVFTEAFKLADELGDEALATIPAFHAAFSTLDTDHQAALPMFDRAIELARKHGNADQEAYALAAKGMTLARLGRFEESRAASDAALQIVRAINSPITESDVELFTGWANLDMGDTRAGLAHGQRGVQLAVATDNFDCICAGLACVGYGHMQANHMAEAAGSFRDAIEQTKVSGALRFEVLARGGLALTELAGSQASGLADLESALARADEINDPFTAALFSHFLARAHIEVGDPAGARPYLERALDYYQRNDLRPYLEQVQATQAALDASEH